MKVALLTIGLVLALIVAIILVAVCSFFMEKEQRMAPPIRMDPPIRNMTWNNVKLGWKL